MMLSSVFCLLPLMILALGFGVVAQSETCSYTFIVPSESASQVWPSSVSDSRMLAAENTIDNQQALINYQQSQIQLLSDRIAALEASNVTTDETFSVKTSYIRWGRTVCPSTSELVYAGYAGNSYYNKGGGVNYQCLTTDPEWHENARGGYQSQNYMYGVEYQYSNTPVWPSTVSEHDAPCAVCLVQGRSVTRMIPGKLSCPDGWALEYNGFLVSNHHVYTGSTFECLDSEFENDVAGHANDNGGLFYVVEAVCGSLPCPPYQNGLELSCVVCTK